MFHRLQTRVTFAIWRHEMERLHDSHYRIQKNDAVTAGFSTVACYQCLRGRSRARMVRECTCSTPPASTGRGLSWPMQISGRRPAQQPQWGIIQSTQCHHVPTWHQWSPVAAAAITTNMVRDIRVFVKRQHATSVGQVTSPGGHQFITLQ